jgi:DNA-binding LacI/PurR family transcriptional regulator
MASARRVARARLVDVAERAGVSKSVASRALNGDTTLSLRPETLQRIRSAADELGYRPHAGARALANVAAGALALLVPDLSNPFFLPIIRGAVRRASELDHFVVIVEDDGQGTPVSVASELFNSGRVDGLIIASGQHEFTDVRADRIEAVPHVFVNRIVPGSNRNVSMDHYAATKVAGQYLLDHGHTRIAHLAGPADNRPSTERIDGFTAVMRGARLEPIVYRSAIDTTAAVAATRRFLDKQGDSVTAFLVGNWVQAVGVRYELARRGLTVPDHMSVIVTGSGPEAEFLVPGQDCIDLPYQELGAASVDLVLGQVQGKPARDVRVATAPTVRARGSVAAPGRRAE